MIDTYDREIIMGRHHPNSFIHLVLTAFVVMLSFSGPAHATQHQEIRLFVVEKSKNPQNILVIYAHVNPNCEIQSINDGREGYLFDFYWMMNGTTFKPTHRLIKKAARKRFEALNITRGGSGFAVRLTDLKELNHDLPSDRIHIAIDPAPRGECRSRVLLNLGPSGDHRTIAIETIYSKAKTFLGIPIGIHYIEIRGKDSVSGNPISVRFDSHISSVYTQDTDNAQTVNDE